MRWSPGRRAVSWSGATLAYFEETIAHSALLGVVLSLVLRIDLVIGIFASACAVTLLMFHLRRRGTLPAHGGLAVGLVTLAFFPNIRVDLTALLFGDILAVSHTDLTVIWGGGAPVLVVIPPATARRFASSPEQMAVAALLLFTVTRLRLLRGSRTAR